MTPEIKFSRRHAHEEAIAIAVREEAPREFREFLRNTIQHFHPHDLRGDGRDFVFIALGKVPRHSWRAAMNEILWLPWYKVYDLLETFYAKMCSIAPERIDDLRTLVNNFFEEHGYAYKLTSEGHVEHRGGESFELSLQTADSVLSEASLSTAKDEIRKAVDDLSKRPRPDLSGAIQHAMAGLECAARDISREPKLELGKITKRYPELFPPPLGDVVAQLYGYSSNNGRHLIEGGEPELSEAELIVGIAATTATYLARKKIS